MIKTLLAALVFSSVVFAQKPECDHLSTAKERFDHIRVLPPVKVLYFDGLTIEYSHEDRTGLYLGSFKISPSTKLPSDFGKTFKTVAWWMLYCSKDNHLYSAHPLAPEQRKALK